jgi:hypothetical protein
MGVSDAIGESPERGRRGALGASCRAVATRRRWFDSTTCVGGARGGHPSDSQPRVVSAGHPFGLDGSCDHHAAAQLRPDVMGGVAGGQWSVMTTLPLARPCSA